MNYMQHVRTVDGQRGHVGLFDPGHVLRHADVVTTVRLLHVLDHQVACKRLGRHLYRDKDALSQGHPIHKDSQ